MAMTLADYDRAMGLGLTDTLVLMAPPIYIIAFSCSSALRAWIYGLSCRLTPFSTFLSRNEHAE
jgi:hypothetical protein